MTIVRQIKPDEWEIGRSVRLAALQDSPSAFSETNAEAVAMPDDFWQGRAERGAKGETSFCAIAFADDEPIGMEWNVRATDFTRYPDWDWIVRPDLVEAFFEGYGRLTPEEEQQRLVAHVRYALTAVVWGRANEYHGFAEEGRNALRHLGKLLQ